MCRYIEGTDIFLYDIFNTLSIIVMLVYNLLQFKSKRNILGNHFLLLSYRIGCANQKVKQALINVFTVVEILIMTLAITLMLSEANTFFGDIVGTGVNYFGTLYPIPIVLFILSIVFAINPIKQLDLLAPCLPLTMVVTKIACFCAGCCYGIPWEHGLYYEARDEAEFPVQLVECGLALLIFIFLIIHKKRAKPGTLLPIYTIMYCSTRFFSEFTRSEENVLWIFKTYHILCFIGIVLGVIELLATLKYGERISNWFDQRYSRRIEARMEKFEALGKEKEEKRAKKRAKKEARKKRKTVRKRKATIKF